MVCFKENYIIFRGSKRVQHIPERGVQLFLEGEGPIANSYRKL